MRDPPWRLLGDNGDYNAFGDGGRWSGSGDNENWDRLLLLLLLLMTISFYNEGGGAGGCGSSWIKFSQVLLALIIGLRGRVSAAIILLFIAIIAYKTYTWYFYLCYDDPIFVRSLT